MNRSVKINSYEKVTTHVINSFSVSVLDVVLFVSVTLNVFLKDANGVIVNCSQLTLTGTDYTNWGGDDNYILNYVSSKLGFTVSSDDELSGSA